MQKFAKKGSSSSVNIFQNSLKSFLLSDASTQLRTVPQKCFTVPPCTPAGHRSSGRLYKEAPKRELMEEEKILALDATGEEGARGSATMCEAGVVKGLAPAPTGHT